MDLVVALACVAGTFGGIQRVSEAGAWVRKSTRRIPIPRIRAASRNTCANEKFPKERATEAERGAGSEREKRAKSGWMSGGGSAVPLSRVARFVRRETEAEREGNARRPRRRRHQIPPRDSPVLCARAPCPAPRSPCSSSSLETRSLAWVGSVRVFGRSPKAPFRSRDASGHRSRGQCAHLERKALFQPSGRPQKLSQRFL